MDVTSDDAFWGSLRVTSFEERSNEIDCSQCYGEHGCNALRLSSKEGLFQSMVPFMTWQTLYTTSLDGYE